MTTTDGGRRASHASLLLGACGLWADPTAFETLDQHGDGNAATIDCDDLDDTVGPDLFWLDADGDGAGDSADSDEACEACETPEGTAAT